MIAAAPQAALEGIRVCDLSGQLAGAGATRVLAAFGAEVIRIEDPVRQGRWDITRGGPPFVDERRGLELGCAFNNHNAEKLGITINLRTDGGRDVLRRLVAESDVVTENFSAGVMDRLGFSYEALRNIKEDIIYVANSGFGCDGPYSGYKSWGPVVQAVSGLTLTSGLPGLPPAGWGYSLMDHQGANFMVVAILAALVHRNRTGEGQFVDLACTEAGVSLLGPVVLDAAINGRVTDPAAVHSNHGRLPVMSPHNIYPCAGDDNWIAIACRNDDDWKHLKEAVGGTLDDDVLFGRLEDRLRNEDELDRRIGAWTAARSRSAVSDALRPLGVPVRAVARPGERIDDDPNTAAWGLWPVTEHPEIGSVRVDGLPVHLSSTDWHIARGAPLLGQHTDEVLRSVLAMDDADIEDLRQAGAI